jgi:cyclopropane fatty-acyl-phospholipid synthase-like methyltransferase
MHNGVLYGDQHEKFDKAFLMPDPWGMKTEREQQRFKETNRIIERIFGRPKRVLEIGSAEGHQSKYLAEICNQLVGTDVSERALSRARHRCPSATFHATDILSDSCELQLEYFDLVVACEVLYYVGDVPTALKRMEKLGRNCLVTFSERESQTMQEHMKPVPLAGKELIQHDQTTWHAMWWPSSDVPADSMDNSIDRQMSKE